MTKGLEAHAAQLIRQAYQKGRRLSGKSGKWIKDHGLWRCSECGRDARYTSEGVVLDEYCNFCSARMKINE